MQLCLTLCCLQRVNNHKFLLRLLDFLFIGYGWCRGTRSCENCGFWTCKDISGSFEVVVWQWGKETCLYHTTALSMSGVPWILVYRFPNCIKLLVFSGLCISIPFYSLFILLFLPPQEISETVSSCSWGSSFVESLCFVLGFLVLGLWCFSIRMKRCGLMWRPASNVMYVCSTLPLEDNFSNEKISVWFTTKLLRPEYQNRKTTNIIKQDA